MMLLLSLLFSLLLLFITSPSSAQEGGGWKEHELKVAEALPDFADPKIAHDLKCSGCGVIVQEIDASLQKLMAKKGLPLHKLKKHDKLEVLYDFCKKIVPEYGLQMRNNIPTTSFSKDNAISRARGNWVTAYLNNICGEIIGEYDETIATAKSLGFTSFCTKEYDCHKYDLPPQIEREEDDL